MSENPAARRVLILGGGVGGLTTAEQLRPLLTAQDRITVIERSDTHVLGLSLLWVLRGWRTADQATARPGPEAIPGVEMLRASVVRVDLSVRQVVTDQGIEEFDALVIAMGAELHMAGVPGLEQSLASGSAAQFYTLPGASEAHRLLRDVTSGTVSIVVSSMPYRCPAAPWEAALLVDDLLRERGVRDDVAVQVITPEPHPMPVAGPAVGAQLTDMLHARGIATHVKAAVAGLAGATVHLEDGTTIGADLALVVPPHRAPAPVRELAGGGWAKVDPRTLAFADGVWVLGDSAMVPLPDGRPLPKAATFARGQADVVAGQVATYLGRSTAAQAFAGLGHCFVEVGEHTAARGAGDFFAAGGPRVDLEPPSGELHQAKEAEERAWLDRWARTTA